MTASSEKVGNALADNCHRADYYVVVARDGTAAYVQADHDMTLKNIDRFFGEIASIDELTALWPARNTPGRSR
jgi:nicotinamidase-related amidase